MSIVVEIQPYLSFILRLEIGTNQHDGKSHSHKLNFLASSKMRPQGRSKQIVATATVPW